MMVEELVDALVGVQAVLEEAVRGTWPEAFEAPLAYPVFGGGKRIRPALCLASARAISGGLVPPDADVCGAAVELVHTYSLVHDDLPAMDDDDERRGRPTVHVAFDEPTAILVGDALLTEAFSVLCTTHAPPAVQIQMVRALAEAAGRHGMVGGQALDVGVGGVQAENIDALFALHRGKTGALIKVSCVLGGLAAGANEEQLASLAKYGAAVGLAFQLADDVLDADEDAEKEGTPSVVKFLGVEETTRRAHEMAEQAVSAVRHLPEPDWLIALARFTVERTV